MPGQRRARAAAAKRETRLNWFVCFVAFGEWAGNAFGMLAFLWATVVLLGGFCTALNPEDFWFATVMIFIEAFRMFSSNYKLDHQSLFGTTRAVKFIRSIGLMFMRPHEWNEVVAIVGLFCSLIMQCPLGGVPTLLLGVAIIFASKMQFPGALQLTSRLRQHQRLLLWALLVALLLITGLEIHTSIELIYRDRRGTPHRPMRVYTVMWPLGRRDMLVDLPLWCLFQLVLVLAVLLLNLRPQKIANLTGSPFGRKLLSSSKLILALCSAGDTLFLHSPLQGLGISLIILVLSLGSLQTPVDSTLFGRWANIFLYICFFGELKSTSTGTTMVVIIMLTVILVGNLQIPAAVARIVLSSLSLSDLVALNIYPQGKDSNRNLVPSIMVFYVLALCQGTLYLMACIVELFAFFPRRSLVRHSRFRGQWGARAVDTYYQRAYVTCIETGVLATGRTMSLANFSIESLGSTSREMQLAGVSVLDALLQQRNFSEELLLRISSSSNVVRTLVGMLGWTAQQDRDIRLFAARVIAELSSSLRLASVPSMLKLVSSLLVDAENQPAWHHHQQDFLSHAISISINGENVADNQSPGQQSSAEPVYGNGENLDNQTTQGEGDNGGCSLLCQCWQRMKEKHWSIPKEPPLTHQDSFLVLGMLILERLAYDIDNCTEISKATDLIFKITGFISYTSDTVEDDDVQQKAVICSSLNLIRRLSITEGKIGTMLRQELWESPFLLGNLAGILEDSRSDHQIWKPAVDIIAMFALDEEARQEIGHTKVIISKLVHLFLGRDGTTNVYYDQQLRTASGEALTNLAMGSTANCSTILEEPGYELVNDIKNMISDDEYRCVATSLLQNLCALSRDELRCPGARDHLSSALTVVMEKIMTAESKELETLISLASQISEVIPECFAHELESNTNGAGLVQKLVYTLNSNKKPCPKYPRMRRDIIQIRYPS